MKKFFKTLSVVLLVVLLTGCVKQTVHMKVTKDEVTVEVTSAMTSSLMTEDTVATNKAEYEALGFKVKEYKDEENDMLGITFSKTYKLEDVSSSEAVEFHIENIDTELKNGTPKMYKKNGNIYTANFVFDTTEADTDGYSSSELEQYADQFEISYSVTLPGKAKSHNADKVDGTTYTWDISYGERAEINYEFDATAKSSSMLIFVIIGAVVVLVVVVVLLVLKNKKGTNNPVQPQTDVVPPMPMMDNNVVQPTVQPMNNAPVQPVDVMPVVDNTPTWTPEVTNEVPVAPAEPVVPTEPTVVVPQEQVVVTETPVEQPNQNQNM